MEPLYQCADITFVFCFSLCFFVLHLSPIWVCGMCSPVLLLLLLLFIFFIQNKNACHRWLIHTHNICIRHKFSLFLLDYFIKDHFTAHICGLSVLNEMFFFSGVSPSVSLVVSPSRSHTSRLTLSL